MRSNIQASSPAVSGLSGTGRHSAMNFRNNSIKKKLSLILMATSTFAVLLACILFYSLVEQHFQETYNKDLKTLTSIVAYNCQAALTFNVPEDAARILSSVKGRKSIMAVRLYDKEGKLFTEYNNKTLSALPIQRRNELIENNGSLKITQSIFLDDDSYIGSISIYDDRRSINSSKQKGLYIFAITGIFSLLFAFFLASFLQKIISNPILSLTKAVQRLAAGDFTAAKSISINTEDEIGILSEAFIDMSNKLNDSYIKLKSYSHDLEKQVDERTKELRRALDNLTKSQQQLVQSEKLAAIGYMVAGIAHEINNSLNFISGAIPVAVESANKFSNILTDETAITEKQAASDKIIQSIEELLENAMVGVNRTANLVNDLNSFARPSRGHFEIVNLHKEIDTVVLLLQYEFKDRVTIKRQYTDALPPIECLKDQMNQVYMNIMLNASQSIGEHGIIWIKTWIEQAGKAAHPHLYAHISIKDNGAGISKNIQNKIFDPFFTTKKVGEGTGLGLSIAYGIVKSHGGQIVESSSSTGTIFTISIPIKQQYDTDLQENYTVASINHAGAV